MKGGPMVTITHRCVMILLSISLLTGMNIAAAAGKMEDVPRMTKEELKGMLDSPDLVLLDVRQARDWDDSKFKIKGAERKDPGKFNSWKNQLPGDKTLVLYCA